MSAIVWMKHKVLCAQTCIYSKVNIKRYITSLESIAFLFLRGGGEGSGRGENVGWTCSIHDFTHAIHGSPSSYTPLSVRLLFELQLP